MIVDLSVVVNESTPVYPGDPTLKIEPAGLFEPDGWNDHIVSIPTHVGTHIDAPLHMLSDGKSLGQFPIEQFVGRGILVEVGKEFSLKAVQQSGIQAGDIVLFHTGMSSSYHDPSYYETYPVMSEEIAQYLVARQVKMVGVDAGNVDNADGFPIHKILLAGGVLIIENLTNLEQLVDREFNVSALPIKLDLDGAPARVIAETQ